MTNYTKIMYTGPLFHRGWQEALDEVERDYLKVGDYVAWLQMRLDRGEVVGLRGRDNA